MNEFVINLRGQCETVESIAVKIERGDVYMDEVKAYLPTLNETMQVLFGYMQQPEMNLDISPDFIMQVLSDIVYGIEHEDSVYLLDVLRYGLIELYHYIELEL